MKRVFCNLERSGLNPSQTKVCHGEFSQKWFSPYHEIKYDFSSVVKHQVWLVFTLFQFLLWKNRDIYWKSKGKPSKLFRLKISYEEFSQKKHLKQLNSLTIWNNIKKILIVFKGFLFEHICKLLNEKVETIFLENGAKPWKLFESKVCYKERFITSFWSYLGVKNQMLRAFKEEFLFVLQIFEYASWKCVLRNWGKLLATN